jgi:hypothetical protein
VGGQWAGLLLVPMELCRGPTQRWAAGAAVQSGTWVGLAAAAAAAGVPAGAQAAARVRALCTWAAASALLLLAASAWPLLAPVSHNSNSSVFCETSPGNPRPGRVAFRLLLAALALGMEAFGVQVFLWRGPTPTAPHARADTLTLACCMVVLGAYTAAGGVITAPRRALYAAAALAAGVGAMSWVVCVDGAADPPTRVISFAISLGPTLGLMEVGWVLRG